MALSLQVDASVLVSTASLRGEVLANRKQIRVGLGLRDGIWEKIAEPLKDVQNYGAAALTHRIDHGGSCVHKHSRLVTQFRL